MVTSESMKPLEEVSATTDSSWMLFPRRNDHDHDDGNGDDDGGRKHDQ